MELSPANIRSTPSVNLREMRALIQAGVFYRNAADTNWAAACQTQLTLPVALSRMKVTAGCSTDPLATPLKVKVADKLNRIRNGIVLDTRRDENGAVEYYVHYDGQDRRLDEWVGSTRVKRKFADRVRMNKGKTPEAKLKTRPERVKRCPLTPSGPVNYEEVLHKVHEEITKVKYIETVRYGNHELDTWYFSPYPDDYGKTRYLYVCDKCMFYMKNEIDYRKHLYECKRPHPPGVEIYSESDFAIYEVNGRDERFFCQCLCLFAKLFLDDKTIHFATAGFRFYVLCVKINGSMRVAGFFSKETDTPGTNLNCLLVLPQHQRRGFGKLLIQLSYELSIKQNVIGSPEKPLSDMGLASYRSYWAYTLVHHLREKMERQPTALADLSKETFIDEKDILTTLEWLGLTDMKHRPFYGELHFTFSDLDNLLKTKAKPPTLLLNSRRLRWRSMST